MNEEGHNDFVWLDINDGTKRAVIRGLILLVALILAWAVVLVI